MKKSKIIYPITLAKHPNWPTEMRCDGCGFKGWQWMGCTKLLINMYKDVYKIKKCSKCGVGIMETGNNAALPIFILSET